METVFANCWRAGASAEFSLVSWCFWLFGSKQGSCVFRLQSSFLQRRLDNWQSSFFLSANQPLADWRPSMCNNIPAGHHLLRGGWRWWYWWKWWCGGEEGTGGPSIQISINQDGSVHSSSYQIRQMITGIQSTRAVNGEGPSCTAIRPLLASWRSHRRISVFLFLTNRLIKWKMIDVQKIKALCVSTGVKALNLHITNLKLRVFRSARPENTHHSSLNQALLQQR